MKNKIQTILLMALALTSIGSIAASDKESELIQSGFDIVESYITRLNLQRAGMKNFIYLDFVSQLLKHGSSNPKTKQDLEQLLSSNQDFRISDLINLIADSTLALLMINKAELTVSILKKPENKALEIFVTFLTENLPTQTLNTFRWRDPDGSAKYRKPNTDHTFEKIDFKNSLLYQYLKQFGASNKLIESITAIMGVAKVQNQDLECCGVKGREACLTALLGHIKIILDELKLTTIEQDQVTSKFTYTLKGTLFKYNEEEKTDAIKYIPFDEDMKNMGKSMGELIKTKEDKKNFIAGINETAAKDFEIKESSITSKLLVGTTGLVLGGLTGGSVVKFYQSRQNNIVQNPNNTMPTSNQVVANDYYTSLPIAQQ
jgi:hypothetical protein